MRKLSKCFFILLFLWGLAARAQTSNANLTAADSGACTTANACLVSVLNTNQASTVVQLNGTFSATLQFEGTAGGTAPFTWVAVNAVPVGGTTAVTSATTTGAWRIAVAGLAQVRVRCSAFVSGTVAVVITSSQGSSANNTSSGGTPGAGTSSAGVFNISTSCGGSANCLQWVDDDSTDNCGTATTAFMTLINAYAGKGVPQVLIGGSGPGKAYKLTACNLIFSNARGVNIVLQATIDCAMALQSCVQLNATSTSGAGVAYPTVLQVFRIGGGGGFIGGTSLTGTGGNGSATAAGVYVMPQTAAAYIEDIFFGGSGTNAGFGATSAMGSCGVWSVYIDSPISGAWVSRVHDNVNSTSTTAGACGLGNPNGTATSSNTVYFDDDFVFTQGEVSGTGQCGSIGISDGGVLGAVTKANIYGMAIPIQLLGIGHRTAHNQLDSTQCAAGGVSAVIQYGGSGAVGPLLIEGNVAQVGTSQGKATSFLNLQNGSAATLKGVKIFGNQNTNSANAALLGGTFNCTTTTVFCEIFGNDGLTSPTVCGTVSQGWESAGMVGQCYPAAASANINASTIYTPGIGAGSTVSCEVIITQQATTSSTLPQCEVIYTDLWSNTSQTLILTPVLGATATAGCTGTAVTTPTVGTSCQGSAPISPKAGVAVQYATINYASVGGTVMQYQVFVTVQKMND